MDIMWRRFELLDKTKEDKLLKLLEDKSLSGEDLILIFQTLRANDIYFKSLAEEETKRALLTLNTHQ